MCRMQHENHLTNTITPALPPGTGRGSWEPAFGVADTTTGWGQERGLALPFPQTVPPCTQCGLRLHAVLTPPLRRQTLGISALLPRTTVAGGVSFPFPSRLSLMLNLTCSCCRANNNSQPLCRPPTQRLSLTSLGLIMTKQCDVAVSSLQITKLKFIDFSMR